MRRFSFCLALPAPKFFLLKRILTARTSGVSIFTFPSPDRCIFPNRLGIASAARQASNRSPTASRHHTAPLPLAALARSPEGKQMEVTEDLKARPEYEALKDLVASGPAALRDTIGAFSRPACAAAEADDEQELRESLWYAYCAIVVIAASTPFAKQKLLVDFVQNLRRKTLHSKAGDEIKQEDMLVWKDLPTFGWVARDAWNFAPDGDDATDQQKHLWVNQNAFFAQLTALSDTKADFDPLDYSIFGLWSLRTGLEEPRGKGAGGAGPFDDTALRAAGMWMHYAAQTLWQQARAETSFDGDAGAGGGQYESEGWVGFCEARWRAWRDAFTECAKSCSADTKPLVRKAIECMMKADGTATGT